MDGQATNTDLTKNVRFHAIVTGVVEGKQFHLA